VWTVPFLCCWVCWAPQKALAGKRLRSATVLGHMKNSHVPSEIVISDHWAGVIQLLHARPESSHRAPLRLVKALAAEWGAKARYSWQVPGRCRR